MGVFSFPAVAIYDSTATGRSLVTAADQAAARAAIGVDTSDYGLLDSDNTWTGDNTFTQTLTTDLIEPTTDLTLGEQYKNTHIKGAFVRLYDGANLQLNIDSSYCTVYGNGIRASHDNTRPMGYESRIWSETWQGKSFIRGNFTDASNYEYLETTYNSTSNYFQINSAALGTGTVRDIRISRDGDEGIWIDQSGIRFIAANSTRFNVQSSEIRMYKYLRSMNSTSTIGTANIPFPAVYSDEVIVGDGDTGTATPAIGFNNSPNMGFVRASINQMNWIVDAAKKGINFGRDNVGLTSNYALGWRSATSLSSGTHDLTLHRDAAHTLAQRFGTNPQAFRIYGTWTDASNGEYAYLKYDSVTNFFELGSTAIGTGSQRGLALRANGNIRYYIGGVITWNYLSTYTRTNVRLEPWSNGSSGLGSSTKRFGANYFVDGDFSGTLTVNQIQNSLGSEGIKFDANYGYLTDANGASNVLRWGSSGFEPYQVFKPRYDETIDFGATNRRWVTGYFVNLDLKTNFSLFNLGETGDTNTEYLRLTWSTNLAKVEPVATGSGVVRDLQLGTAATKVLVRPVSNQVWLYSNSNARILCSSGGVGIGGNIYPFSDNTYSNGTTTYRWSAVNSYDADFIGTTTLRTFDDGAGNSSSVATQNSSNDSFFLHRTWTGTSGGGSSWIGIKNDYNSTGTAASWVGVSPSAVRVEIANGLRAMWQSAGSQHLLNLHFYPYADNTWQIGVSNRIWTEVWQGAAKIRGSYVDGSNYGYLSIEPDGDDYLIKANSLGTTADAGITIQTSQLSAAGNQPIVFDADYNGSVSFYFGGNNRGYWSKDTLQPNVQVRTTVAYDINRNWNNASTVYQGYEANITDTASDAASSLLNLKVGGTSYLRLQKDGKLLFEKNGGSAAIVQNAGGISILGDNGSTVQSFDQYFNYTYKTFRPITDNQHIGYVSRRFLIKANDIYSKGKIRVYNLGDETDVNSEFLNMYWDTDKAYLTVQKDGTGTEREFIVGHHLNGCTRYNNTSNIIRWSISGTTGTKMYLNSSGLTVYGRVDPQGNKTRDLGTDSTARWRVGYMDTCDLDDGRINQKTSSSSDPSTSEYANDGDWGMHENTSNGHIYLAFNDGGTIYKTQLHSGGGSPSP